MNHTLNYFSINPPIILKTELKHFFVKTVCTRLNKSETHDLLSYLRHLLVMRWMKIYVSTGLYVILAKITVELCWLIFKSGYVKLQIKPIIISNALSDHLSLLNDITFYILFWTKIIRQFELCKTLFQTEFHRFHRFETVLFTWCWFLCDKWWIEELIAK